MPDQGFHFSETLFFSLTYKTMRSDKTAPLPKKKKKNKAQQVLFVKGK